MRKAFDQGAAPEPSWFRVVVFGLACLLWLGVAEAADSNSPIADAAQQQDAAKIRSLLNQDSDVNADQVDGMTALHWAAYHDDTDLVKRLVEKGANVNATNRYGIPVLQLACQNGNGEIVELLLAADADPHVKLRGGQTLLMTAARTGRVRPVKALIAAGADINAEEHQGQTALMWAAADGHADVVKTLIDAGADFLVPLNSGFSPLFFAIREGHTEVVKVLLQAGADVNDSFKPKSGGRRSRSTPLILAIENGHFETASALLQAGADPNAAPAGFTALHAITWVRRPLKGDTDPPPIGSGSLSSLDFVRILLDAGAEIDAQYDQQVGSGGFYNGGRAQFTNAGSTTLMLAARNSDLPLLNLLLDSGADWRLPNADNYTALLAAAGVGALGSGDELPGSEAEAIETVRLLLELGSDINAVTETGETAVHGAAYQERPALIQFLVDHGADVQLWNRKNKFGWTPLMIAQGHRPGNFRLSPKTVVAVKKAMRTAGVEIPSEESN